MSKELIEKYKDIIDNNQFPKYNGVVIDDMDLDGAHGYVDLDENSLNAYGMAHGGLYFTLADTCAAFASRADGRKYVTRQSNMYFISATNSGRIEATGRVIKRTKSFCTVDVEVTDEKGKLLTKSSFDYYCIEPS